MNCDHCGRDITPELATPVTRPSPTGLVEVMLCPTCRNGRGRAVTAGLVVAALVLLAVGLVALLGYLII